MLQGKIDIDTSVPAVTARTTRSLSITAVKPRTEAGRSSNSNSFLLALLSLSLFGTHCRKISSTLSLRQL